MDPAKVLQIITNSTWMVTRLVGSEPVEFLQPQYIVDVPENTTRDSLVHLTARVQQPGAPLHFRIKEGNEAKLFSLGRDSGRLSLVKALDFEEKQQHTLVVEAVSGESRSEANVVVRVLDVNDHVPVFPRTFHEAQITEEDNRHFPKTILTVKATDGDTGRHGRLRYSIRGDGVHTNSSTSRFSIDSDTGAIHLLRPLDRDPPKGRAKWRLKVEATDGMLHSSMMVQVNVKDVNDNSPYFPDAIVNATISEDTPQGSSVVLMEASDRDDPSEGLNARLVYSLEKNVVDEASGRPIFDVDVRRGLVTTAVCCLDRETTRRYALHVVATDGGGLKGTGTVLVDVSDVNDVPPRFSRSEWSLDVSENVSPTEVLATLTVVDPDVSNNFAFRVVPGSGRGWRNFRINGRDRGVPGGDLKVVVPLDYENPQHRRGFRFKVQVSDVGDGNWQNKQHVASTWVNLNLVDANDNSPILSRQEAHLILPEDTPVGTHLATFTAKDLDGGVGGSNITYTISPSSDPRGQFGVGETGRVHLVGGLDRETEAAHTVLVWAADGGFPPRTATATLTVNVTDVNDNPPFLAGPLLVRVEENSAPGVVARVRLDDPDDWRQGHGPPFAVALDARAPPHVASFLRVTHDPRGDEGRGVGVVWTRAALDREERAALLVPLLVRDAGALSSTVTLTLQVADVDDNPMTPAAKTVTVSTVQPQVTAVPLGRVYVRDPDGWHSTTKNYSWVSAAFPGFSLNATTGHLTMDPQTPQGRYELGFRVSDVSQGQVGVRANVTVEVTSVSPGDVIHAIPVTLAADAYRLVREGKEGKSLLRQLEASARAWAGVGGEGVRVVTVQPLQSPITPTTRVWLASPGITSLHHILLHRKEELSRVLGVGVQGVGVGACGAECAGGGCLSRAELGRGYSLVDAHASAVVGPQVEIAEKCGCGWAASTACSPSRCLNGGRCLPTPTGGTRCVCPEGTSGPRCKVLARHFDGGGGWAWAASVPPCPETHISLEVLTASQEATLLYSGPDQHQHLRRLPPDEGAAGDVVSLELVEGRPSLLLDLGGGPVTLTLPSSPSFADLAWHRIDLIWKDELVEMIVDLCSGSSLDGPRIPPDRSAHNASSPPIVPPDAHTCRGAARLPRSARVLDTPQPLQVGGMAHPPPAHAAHGWPRPLRSKSLRGCIRNVRINGELMDLGSGILSLHSTPGCPAVDCTSSGLHCGLHARCQGSPGHLRCECHLGWTGPGCDIPTVPTTFHLNSFVKLALSFTPLGYTSSISLRFRTWQRHGDLVVLSSQDGRDSFGLQLVGGRACVLLQLHPSPPRSICLTQAKLTDGIWHRLTATRYGSATFLTADDGDDDLYNASVSLEGRQLLSVDREGGIRVGGSPEWVGSSVGSEGDFHDGCLDDVRISGRGVSLPPAGDDDDDDGVSASKGVERGCRPPPACANVTCRAPLTCIDTWRSYHCGCGEGTTLDRARRACQDVDECRWAPCLHGGTCLNTAPGYACACPSGFGGRHCHVQDAEGGAALRLSPAALAAVVAWCALLLLLLVCAFLLHQRRSAVRRGVVGGREPQGKGRGAPPRSTPNLLQLRLLKPPKANGQTPCARNPNIADVDVLQVDAASVTSSLEEQRRPPCTTPPSPDASRGDVGGAAEAEGAEEPAEGKRREKRGGGGGGGRGRGGGGGGDAPAGDDLRNYAYEGLESCNGSAKFLGGFREVAHILES